MSSKLARGIWPALCTAFDDSGDRVDADRQRALVRALAETGIQGFFVCGGTGEGKFMSVPERMNVAEVVADEVAGAVRIILQVGATSTANAVELAQHASHIQGIDAVASVAPVDAPNNLEAAVKHYASIGAATDLPFYVYWLMNEADVSANADTFLEAMKAVPNFAGLKFTDFNLYLFGQLIDRSRGELNAISGPDEMALPAMVMGADAAIGSTYNVMPKIFLQMRQTFEAGDLGTAQDCQIRANRVIRLLMQVGVLAGIKEMLGWRGTPVGPPRVGEQLDRKGHLTLRAGLDTLDFEVN
ncbi:MAG: dihydrodipicolinate synthase family protein [Candidatus Latescibacterota bacterium]|nr:dihydrodipicolinate synthase family protein [Candidatus Latescibacterota bacterium]